MGKLDGRIALVTGASGGMGAAHCRALAGQGARVAVCDVAVDPGRALAEEIGGAFHRLDVTSEADWNRVVDRVGETMGPISIVVNNAGIAPMNGIHDIPLAEWNAVLNVNLTGTFLGTRAAVPHMQAVGGGVIVNVSSAGGMCGQSCMAAYTASKWGVRGLTRSAARDLAPFGIRVLSLHPALVRTPMSEHLDLDGLTASYPLQRPGEPEEMARMLLFMVADATFSTGCEFIADGGMLA